MNRKIVVLGAGVSGIAAARLARLLGDEVEICCDGKEEKLPECDLVVASPGVHPLKSDLYRQAVERQVELISELEYGFRHFPKPILAITGTNGKTTTTELTTYILKRSGVAAVAAGNIGLPLADVAADLLEKKSDPEVAVVEVSNFQLELCQNFSPFAAALLNIESDHEDRYIDGFAGYARIKQKIFDHVPPEKRVYGQSFHDKDHRLFMHGKVLVDNGGKVVFDASDTPLSSPHNLENLAAALELSQLYLGHLPELPDAVSGFAPGAHRQQVVLRRNGITFVDDSKATNPAAVFAAIRGIDTPIVILLGGLDKGMDFSPFAKLDKKVRAAVVYGECREKMRRSLPPDLPVADGGSDFRRTCELAINFAEKGDTVLLSPACASMDMFKNYAERGDKFKEHCLELTGGVKK